MKRLFYDLETTGVKHWRNGIHQIAGIIEIDGEIVDEFDLKVQPNPRCQIEDEALKVGGVDLETVQAYPEMNVIYNELVGKLQLRVDKFNKADKFHLIGYNNRSFDDQFLRAFFTQNGDKYFGSWFWADTIDVMVLASDHLEEVRHTMKNFKLKTVCEFMGIEFDENQLHDALYDIRITRQLFNEIRKGRENGSIS